MGNLLIFPFFSTYLRNNPFWNFGYQGSPAVKTLLEKPDLTLDDLLDEEGLLLELKTLNSKLFDFLLIESNFKQLIDNVIREPGVEDLEMNQTKYFKYPYVCAEILGADQQAIVAEFFKTSVEIKERAEKMQKEYEEDMKKSDEVVIEDNEETQSPTSQDSPKSEDKENKSPSGHPEKFEYLDYLFNFLDNSELNFTAAGYFAKIVNNLFVKKPSLFLAYIYEVRPELLEKMVEQISSKSVAEFLAKLLTFESSLLANNEDETYDAHRIKTLSLIIQKLDPKHDVETINNAAYLICETFGKYNTMHHGREVLSSLLDEVTISYFFSVLQIKNSTSSCAIALILGNVFAYYILISSSRPQYEDEYEMNDDYASNSQQGTELKDDLPLVGALIENIPSIISYLAESQGSSITNQYGANIIPFGAAKLKLIELLIIALKANNKSIQAKLAQSGFIETLLELFLRFEFNNMLHNQVEKVIAFVIEGNYEDLRVSLFEKADVLSFIINASNQSEYVMAGKHKRKIRKGYMGQIVRLSNKIVESKDEYILAQIEKNPLWKGYVAGQLTEVNQKNQVNLGGRDPRDRFIDDEDDYQLHDQFDRYGRISGENDKTFGRNYKNDNDDDDDDDEDDQEEQEGNIDDNEEHLDDEDEEERKDSLSSRLSPNGLRILRKLVDGAEEDAEEEETLEEKDVNETEKPKEIQEEEETIENVKEEFFSNVYFKNEEFYTTDDVLSELGLL